MVCKVKLRKHIYKEGNPKLVIEAKKQFKEYNGKLFCEVCGFNFEKVYGELGIDYIEAHHIKAISILLKKQYQKVYYKILYRRSTNTIWKKELIDLLKKFYNDLNDSLEIDIGNGVFKYKYKINVLEIEHCSIWHFQYYNDMNFLTIVLPEKY